MCFLLTVTLMTYCIRKASSGSCMMEICILSFLVILPVLAVLAALYLLLPFFSGSEEDQKRSARAKCEKPRIVGLLQRVYPDSEQLMFKCNMLNFGDNLGVVLTECFESGEPQIGYHFVSSKSPFWHKDNTLHRILTFNTIAQDQGNITIMQVFPSLPEPCATEEDDNLAGDDNYFYVEHDFHPESEHILIGWQARSRIATKPYQEMPVTKNCQPGYPSAIVFTRIGRYFTGFQTGKCDEDDNFQESLIPYSIFLDQIHQLYPNVEFKNNPQQQKGPPAAFESMGPHGSAHNRKSSRRKSQLHTNSNASLRKLSGSSVTTTNKVGLVIPLQLKKEFGVLNTLSEATIERALQMDFKDYWMSDEGPTGTAIQRSQHRAVLNSNLSMSYLKFCASQYSSKVNCSNCKPIMSCCLQFDIPGCVAKVLKLCAACSDQPGLNMCCKEFIDLVKGKKFIPNRLFTRVDTTTVFSKLALKRKLIRERGVMAYKRSKNTAIYVIP